MSAERQQCTPVKYSLRAAGWHARCVQAYPIGKHRVFTRRNPHFAMSHCCRRLVEQENLAIGARHGEGHRIGSVEPFVTAMRTT